MGAVRRPGPQPQQRIVCIRSEEPPKNRARPLGPIGQSSWRYLPDYTRHLWPIKDELGTATWLVKGRPEGSRRDIIAPCRRVYRTRISPPRQGIVRACRGRSNRPGGSVRMHRTVVRAIGWASQQLLKKGYPMLQRLALPCVAAFVMASSPGLAQSPSPNGVKTLNPPGAIKAEGTWSLGVRAGDFVFVAGMQASIQRPTRWFRIRRPAFAKPNSISG
jgi:hypothetical protein